MKGRLARSTLGLAFARIAAGTMLVAASVVLAREQGARELGVFGLALTVAVYASVVADTGISQYLLPALARRPREEWRDLWADVVRFQLRSALPYAAVYAALVVAVTSGEERLTLLAVLPWWLVLRVNGAARSVFTVAEQVSAEATATIVEAVATLALLTVVATLTGSTALAALTLSGGAIVGLVLRLRGLEALGVGSGRATRRARELVRAAAAFNGYTVLTTLYLRIDVVILSVLGTQLALGLYQPAVRVGTALIIVPDALAMLLLGRLARRPSDRAVRASQERVLALGLPIGLALVLVAALAGRPLLGLVYGPGFRQAALALTLMVATVPVSLLGSMNGNSLTALGRQRTRLACLSVTAVAAVGLGIPAIWLWSYTGAAGVSLVNELLLAGAYAVALWRTEGRGAVLLPRLEPVERVAPVGVHARQP